MDLPVIYTANAAEDLEGICNYVAARDGPERASDLFDKIVQMIDRLTTYPERGNVPKELEAIGLSGFRELHYKPYRIFYRVDNAVIIYCILDGRRDMQTLLQQRLTR